MFLVSTNLLQNRIGKDRVYFNRADYMSVGQDMLQTWTYGHILSHNIVHSHYFGNLVCPHFVQDRLQAKSTPTMAFHQEREDNKDKSSMNTTMMEIEDEEISEGVLTKKEARSSSGSSHQGGGPNQVRARSSSGSRTSIS